LISRVQQANCGFIAINPDGTARDNAILIKHTWLSHFQHESVGDTDDVLRIKSIYIEIANSAYTVSATQATKDADSVIKSYWCWLKQLDDVWAEKFLRGGELSS
jgi:hypothetical protein